MGVYSEFLEKYNYDIRRTGDARWIDQKCTFDVISIIADCILEFISDDDGKEFTVSDIWHSEYSRENVIEIFSKPDPGLKATNEYDKYFGQPIKLLSYSNVLTCEKVGNKYFYKVNNRNILENIALRPSKALQFLYEYIEKVLKDSNIYSVFEQFFKLQTKESYMDMREEFINFTINNTNINGKTECGRIFTKILNPLAFKMKARGTERGRLSKNIITMNDLQYNRANWRDELSGKEKYITRAEHKLINKRNQSQALTKYTIEKAKKALKKYNQKYYGGISEVKQQSEIILATQAHHIFPQSDYPNIADYVENLIMITPNQHFVMAHPKNNTMYIDKDFQYICLLAKSISIMDDLQSDREDKFYSFTDYIFVLNTGLKTEAFNDIDYMDFATIFNKIDSFYDCSTNKYYELIDINKNYTENELILK